MAGFWEVVVNGTPVNFDAFGAYIEEIQGVGAPSMNNISLDFAQGDGSLYQQTFAKPRTFTLNVYVPGSSLANLHALRKALFDALKPNRSGVYVPTPLVLRYSGGGTRTIQINAVYDSGLEWTALSGFTERFPLRFIAYDPYWYATAGSSSAVAVQTSIATAGYMLQRSAAGVWAKMGTGGPNNAIQCLVQDNAGNIYAGGTFTTPGTRLAKWNGSVWSALSTGVNGLPYDMAIGPDGYLYIAGAFTTPFPTIVKWDGTAFSRLGTTLTGSAYSLMFGPDGTLYVSGNLLISGVATNIAYWNGTAWVALGSLATYAFSIALSNSNVLYTATSTASVNGIGVWNGTSYTDIGDYTIGGAAGTVNKLRMGPDGYLYLCGNFDTIGGVAASGVARWNGVAWQPLGLGLGGLVSAYGLSFDDAGILYVSGRFTSAGGVGLADSIAKWNGTAWSGLDVDLPGTPDVRGIITTGGKVTLGYSTTGTATTTGYTALTVVGSADAYPVITMTGPGTIYQILNTTTGASIYFNLTLLAGETVTLDLSPGVKTFTSSFRGNILGSILPTSDIMSFRLAPGVNNISVYSSYASGTGSAAWRERWWSIDGSA